MHVFLRRWKNKRDMRMKNGFQTDDWIISKKTINTFFLLSKQRVIIDNMLII